MELCKDLGLDEIPTHLHPLGATINMGGAAITISIMALAAAHTRYQRRLPDRSDPLHPGCCKCGWCFGELPAVLFF